MPHARSKRWHACKLAMSNNVTDWRACSPATYFHDWHSESIFSDSTKPRVTTGLDGAAEGHPCAVLRPQLINN